jgi:NAD(P)-dependent dehydrogenase (short-subunit alcohol dehydrogenase family)
MWTRAGAAGVVIAGRRQEKLDDTLQTLNEINTGVTKTLAVKADLKLEHEVINLFQKVKDDFGRPADVVIANAGWTSDLRALAEESVSTWWSVYVRCSSFIRTDPMKLFCNRFTGNQCFGRPQHHSSLDQLPT